MQGVNIIEIFTWKRKRKYVEEYGFLTFARKCGDKYSKNLMNTATKTGINAAKTISVTVIQKSAEATWDLIANEIADKITSVGKTKNKEDKTNEVQEIEIPPEKLQQIIDDLRLF